MSSYSCMGTACLKAFVVNSFENSYCLPISVIWAAVTRSCSTSLCAEIGCWIQASMRQERNLARDDMAGLSNFMVGIERVNDRRKGIRYGHDLSPKKIGPVLVSTTTQRLCVG